MYAWDGGVQAGVATGRCGAPRSADRAAVAGARYQAAAGGLGWNPDLGAANSGGDSAQSPGPDLGCTSGKRVCLASVLGPISSASLYNFRTKGGETIRCTHAMTSPPWVTVG